MKEIKNHAEKTKKVQTSEIEEEERDCLKIFGNDIYDKIVYTLQSGSCCSNEELEILLLQLIGGTCRIHSSGIVAKGNINVLLIDQPALKTLFAKNLAKFSKNWVINDIASRIAESGDKEKRPLRYRDALPAIGGITVVENVELEHKCIELERISNSHTSLLVITNSTPCGPISFGIERTRELIQSAVDWCDAILINEKTPEKRNELVDHMLQIYSSPKLPDSVEKADSENKRLEDFLSGVKAKEAQSSHPENRAEEYLLLNSITIKRYIAAAQAILACIPPELLSKIKEDYLKKSAESKLISEHYVSGVIKFAEASARAHLRDKATEGDVERALRLMNYWLDKFKAAEEKWGNEEEEDHRGRGRKRSQFFTAITPKYNLDDVILSLRNKRQIEECLAELKNKSLIYEQWGFSNTTKRTKGIVMVFTGAPGTGKTMTAEALAKHLGKDLLVVNYAQLESCWVGETEKNIERAFKEAKDKNAIILFDEADTLLTSRETGFVHPYHIKVVNSMLEKIETFDGIMILATNLSSILDPALERRIDIAIQFDFPDADMREQIYKKMIPDRAPIANDVGFKELAKKYPLAGGKILNVVKSAVRSAVLRESKEITMEDFERAAKVEYERSAVLQRSCMSKASGGKHAPLDEDVPKYA